MWPDWKPMREKSDCFAAPLLLLALVCLPGCSCDVLSLHEDLDIRTGRIKTTRYLMFLPVRAKTHDTVISKALPADRVKGVEPEWRKVNTFYWLMPYSPYWEYHGATGCIRNYEAATRAVRFSPEALQHVALRATELWQEGRGGNHYLYDVAILADMTRANGLDSLDVADLATLYDSCPWPRTKPCRTSKIGR